MSSLDELRKCYGTFLQISFPLLSRHCLSEFEWNFLFLAGFPDSISEPILPWLAIIKPDIHSDGLDNIEDVLDAAEFTLSQFAFHSLYLSQPAPASSSTVHSSSSPILLLLSSSYVPIKIPYPVYISTNPPNTLPATNISQANSSATFPDSPDNSNILMIEPEIFTSDSDSDSDSDSNLGSDSNTENISSPDLAIPDFQLYLVDAYQGYQTNYSRAISLPAHSNLTGFAFIPPHSKLVPPSLGQITYAFTSYSSFSMSSNHSIHGPIQVLSCSLTTSSLDVESNDSSENIISPTTLTSMLPSVIPSLSNLPVVLFHPFSSDLSTKFIPYPSPFSLLLHSILI